MSMPQFTQEALCATDANPNDWFPDFDEVRAQGASQRFIRTTFSHTPSAMRARSVCMKCPAYDECLEYSLQFTGMYGIWANKDQFEREREQQLRGMNPDDLIPFYTTYELPRSLFVQDNYLPIESEWADDVW